MYCNTCTYVLQHLNICIATPLHMYCNTSTYVVQHLHICIANCCWFRMVLVLLVAVLCVGARSKSLYEGEGEGGDPLHPDTFKRLAAALYQRGDKAENR